MQNGEKHLMNVCIQKKMSQLRGFEIYKFEATDSFFCAVRTESVSYNKHYLEIEIVVNKTNLIYIIMKLILRVFNS